MAAAPLLEPRQEVGVAELLGRVYVVGGYRQDHSTANTVEVYDPAAARWSFAAPMPRAVNHPMVAVLAERLYVLGGDSGGGALSTTQEYDLRTNTWGLRTPMPTPRNHAAGGVIGGRLHVVGGRPPNTLAVHEAFDPTSSSRCPPAGRAASGRRP